MHAIKFALFIPFLLSLFTAAAAQPPRNWMVYPGDAEVTLAWDPVPGAIGYNVKRASTMAGPATAIATNLTGTTFTDTGLRNGSGYFYAVSSVSSAGESADSIRLRAVPSAPVLDVLPAGAKVEKLAGGFQFTEGPAWVPAEGGYLVFSDIPANRLVKWTPSAVTTFRQPSGQANGNTLDREGRLLTCEHANRRITRTEPDGTVVALVTEYNGKQFNAPNDAVVKSDGTVWFTDPNYGLGPLQPGRYVYRFDPSDGNGTVTLVGEGFDQPNGLCFSPDETRLYVADSGTPRHIRVFDVLPDNTLTNSRVFAAVNPGNPDGMRVDAQGRLWSSAGDGVHIFDPDGTLLGKLRTPESAANVGFGGTNREMVFITANTSLYGISRMPDLAVTAIHRHPSTVVEGQPVRFSVVVRNQGTVPAPAGNSTRVVLSLDTNGPIIWTAGFGGAIPPDGSAVLFCDEGVQGNAWIATEGTTRIRAMIDPDNELAESNETNNVFSLSIRVEPRPPDTDQDGSSDTDEEAAGTDPAAAGSNLRITAVEASAPGEWRLAWSSVPGKAYRLVFKQALDDAEWYDLGEAITASEATGSRIQPLPGGPHGFFRIRVVP